MPPTAAPAIVSPEVPPEQVARFDRFLSALGNAAELPAGTTSKDSFSDLIRGFVEVDRIERGRVSCSFSVKPPIVNPYKGLHGGVVASLAERVSTACARTVVPEDRELFLGELSTSYLSAAPLDAEVVVVASLVRSGRNITVVCVEFRLKQTGKLAYTAHATFFNLPGSKL
ncbi:Acyl-coenzyme A thioesterase 13-like protein [Drosera capensis]